MLRELFAHLRNGQEDFDFRVAKGPATMREPLVHQLTRYSVVPAVFHQAVNGDHFIIKKRVLREETETFPAHEANNIQVQTNRGRDVFGRKFCQRRKLKNILTFGDTIQNFQQRFEVLERRPVGFGKEFFATVGQRLAL
jgi:hypothetical protein